MSASARGQVNLVSVAHSGLVRDPVVVHRRPPKDLVVQWVDGAGDASQRLRPVGLELLVHQPLGEVDVLDPREAIVDALEVAAASGELPGQPLAAVEADLDVEREPGLQPDVHEAEDGVQEVLVEVPALGPAQPEPALVLVLGAVVLEAHAGLDRLERAHQALLVGVLCQQRASEILLACGARRQLAHRSVIPLGLR